VSDGGARLAILDAGRATPELSKPAQIDLIDEAEVGRRGVAPCLWVAFEVTDAAAATAAAERGGATVVAPTTRTSCDSLTSRLEAPAGLQITPFQELGEGPGPG
jgi:hypothetical protein